MIRVPLRDLRAALSNPVQYVNNLRRGTSAIRPRPSKYLMLRFAVGEFHKANDAKHAQDYLEQKITAKFKNVRDLHVYVNQLQSYIREFRALGNTSVRVRDNIAVEVPSRFADIAVSGQSARFDLVPSGGYAAWVFVRNMPDWEQDPRMPLLQSAYAKRLAVSLEEVAVGVYDFKLAGHFSRRYSQADVDTAYRNLLKLLDRVKSAA